MISTVFQRIQDDTIAKVLIKEGFAVVEANPTLLSSYTRVCKAYEEGNWTVILTEATRILRDPSMKQVVYKQLKRIREGLRENKSQVQALLSGSVEETDADTIALLRAGVDFLMTVGGLMDEIKMRKVVYDICVEVGGCCKSFVEVVDQHEKEKKAQRKWGFFSGRK